MKQLLLLASIVALASTAPAWADPGKGKGNPQFDDARWHANHCQPGMKKCVTPAQQGAVGYGAGGCPPGLAKKNNGCLPPGQAKKLYNRGQRWPGNYGYAWNYNQIPYDLRNRYGFDPDDRYYYGDGYLYQVDPTTMLISQVVSAILR